MANRNLILPQRVAYCASEEEMQALGTEVGSAITPRTVMSLDGPLGAGKTCFVRGLVAGTGADISQVASPTFPLIHEYSGGRTPFVHLDLYRIGGESELAELGLDDYWNSDAVIAVEWGSRFPAWMPTRTHWISFEIDGEGRRVSEKLSS